LENRSRVFDDLAGKSHLQLFSPAGCEFCDDVRHSFLLSSSIARPGPMRTEITWRTVRR
jgi:hypothetical protein